MLPVDTSAMTDACAASSGALQMTSNFPGPPLPDPPAPAVVHVAVDWSNTTGRLETHPSLQVVSHALLMRDSPIHDVCFAMLARLNASYVRYVPWQPTPLLGVGALNPPSGSILCGGEPVSSKLPGAFAALDCGDDGGMIDSVRFASFGNPSGHCGTFTRGVCHAPGSMNVVAKACVGRQNCVLPSSSAAFPGLPPTCLPEAALAVAVTCSNKTKQFTYWNMTLPDQQFLDFWQAVQGNQRPMIPNFSTPPTWL